jgi:hypothetical protein
MVSGLAPRQPCADSDLSESVNLRQWRNGRENESDGTRQKDGDGDEGGRYGL